MDDAKTGARFDWLVDLGGAGAPGLSAGFAALKLAPSLGVAPAIATVAIGSAGFGLGLLAMRLVKPAPRKLPLPAFPVAAIAASADDALLLDERYEEPLLLTEIFPDDALLLDDRLVVAVPQSRVVQLFAQQTVMPTPGQLKERIDRHLAAPTRQSSDPVPIARPDATNALYAALDELRRSLR